MWKVSFFFLFRTKNNKLNTVVKKLCYYSCFGLFGASVDFGLFYWLAEINNYNYMYSNTISISFAVTISFILNYFFTFKMRNCLLYRSFLFSIMGIIGFLISSISLFFLVEYINITMEIAKITSMLFAAVFQYILNDRITFRSNI